MANERRRAPRYPLIATAEIIEPQTNLRLRGRTADLSLVGCYVEMRNALPVHTAIRTINLSGRFYLIFDVFVVRSPVVPA